MTARAIEVRVMLMSSDVQTVDILRRFMEREAMHVEVCSSIASATTSMCQTRFDAIVVDFQEKEAALELLRTQRKTAFHKSAVVLAILHRSEETPGAFRAGVGFVLVKPLSSAALTRTLRACYPLMVRERRRYFRCPLQVSTYVSVGSHRELMATSANISEGGMAISNSPAFQLGVRVGLRLTLPGTQAALKIDAEVCWSDESGRSGMKFVQLPRAAKEQLLSWLAARLEDSQ